MSWIKQNEEVIVDAELEGGSNRIDTTDAYEVEITDAHVQESKQDGSKSLSLVIGVKTEDGETNTTYFTIQGRTGETWYEGTVAGKTVKKQLFGLNIVDTLFNISLEKSIFDCEPETLTYDAWDNDAKEMVATEGLGFADLIGKKVGICLQMKREINGTDTKEFGNIAHFFDLETGLFHTEVDSDNRKLDRWLKNKKEYIVKEIEKPTSSFGKKKTEKNDDGVEVPKSKKWGRN